MAGKSEDMHKLMAAVEMFIRAKRFAYVMPEHLLWCLIPEQEFQQLAQQCQADVASLKKNLKAFLSQQERLRGEQEFVVTDDYKVVISNAMEFAVRSGSEPGVRHLVVALLQNQEDSHAAYFLMEAGITPEKLKEQMEEADGFSLERYAVNLNRKAAEGRIDKLVGREEEIRRITQILHKKRTCNPLLLAMPGVGKTAIVEGLAQRILEGAVPDALKSCTIWALDLHGMLAGAKLRGDFEERLKKTIEAVMADKDAILFIDEVHVICGGHGGAEDNMSAAAIIKPYLTDSRFRVIGATTYDDYRRFIQKDRALARRFKKIDILEPSRKETLDILKGLRDAYMSFHGIAFPDEVLQSIVDLSAQYIKDQFFPDKAIEVLDEVGSAYRCKLLEGTEATVGDVEAVVAKVANLPCLEPKTDGISALKALGERVKSELYGQDAAVDKVTSRIKSAKAGLSSPGKPLGVFALIGDTGVGKTELARQFARNLDATFLKFDMSEYSEKNSTSKLIGTSPGYVGFEQAGALTDAVLRNPNCVILFDEIEKADASVYNLLLQVMDEGRLTDNNNRVADFTQSVIFMTSNAGCAAAAKAGRTLGFTGGASRKHDVFESEVKNIFPPEFRNRFTEILILNPVDRTSMGRIVDKELRHLNERLAEKNITVELTEDARTFLADTALEEGMGGRPVERLVNRHVTEKLVDAILFDGLAGSRVLFEKDGDTLAYRAEAAE